MRRYAGYPYELLVGDGGSTDGSLEMLRGFEKRGALTLEVHLGERPRMHGEWLDLWLKECPERYCVFSDSDVEYLGAGWLSDMMEVMTSTQCAMVCAAFSPADSNYVHPVYGDRMHLAARPSPWLMLLDEKQVRDASASFKFHETEATDAIPTTYYDVGGYFFDELVKRQLTWRSMPESWLVKVHHFGGMSWGLPGGGGNRTFMPDAPAMRWSDLQRVRAREIKKRTVVRWHLEKMRRTAVPK